MLLKQTKKVGGILIYDNVFAWDMDAETVRGEVFSVLVVLSGRCLSREKRGATYPPEQRIEERRNILL